MTSYTPAPLTAPQSLSAERREEVLALQRQARKIARQIATDHFGSEPMIAFPFENRCQELIFAALSDLDAQHAERVRAEVEKMRDTIKAEILEVASYKRVTKGSVFNLATRVGALPIEGTGQ